MSTVEILRARKQSPNGEPMLRSIADAAKDDGDTVVETQAYQGCSDWLVVFGVGAAVNHAARTKQVARGGRALLIDLGYWGRKKVTGYLRISIDHDHPQALLDRTPPDPSRWAAHGIALREDADPAGPIILVGLGRKSRSYLGAGENWERRKLEEITARYPGRTVIHRPKVGLKEARSGFISPHGANLPCERDDKSPIEALLKGASLVVCRHSNVGVDAVVAGVPVEAEDGAVMWLAKREFSPENRLDFLCRLSWWQYRSTEAAQAWQFAKGIVE